MARRAFNVQQQADALLGNAAVREVSYDPLSNPTRLSVVYATPRKSGSSSGALPDVRKAEIFINNRISEQASSSQDGGAPCPSWCGFEAFRQVSQAARQGSVSDYAHTRARGQRERVQRSGSSRGAFLQPQDPRYFDTGGQAVAVLQLTRVDSPAQAATSVS